MLVYQRVRCFPIQTHEPYHLVRVFPASHVWCSCMSHEFPTCSHDFPLFPMIFPWFSHIFPFFPMTFQWFPHFALRCSHDFPTAHRCSRPVTAIPCSVGRSTNPLRCSPGCQAWRWSLASGEMTNSSPWKITILIGKPSISMGHYWLRIIINSTIIIINITIIMINNKDIIIIDNDIDSDIGNIMIVIIDNDIVIMILIIDYW